MFYNMVLNIILILFPLICYILYLANITENKEKTKEGYLSLALYSSLFLYVKFSSTVNDYTAFILVNVPLLISIIKNKNLSTFILSVLIVLLSYSIFNFNIMCLVIEYLVYFILSFVLKGKKNMLNIIIVFSVIKTVMSYVYAPNFNILGSFIFLFIIFLILYLFNIGESMMDMHLNIQKLKKEKVINDSIFKITHEIKNPIAVCKGYLDMFDATDTEKSEKYVKILKDEIDHTLELLKDFLAFSKINIDKEEMDIGMLLDEVYSDFKNYVEANRIEFNYNNVDDDIYINGDYKRLKQVFINLIKNSMEAIKEKNERNGLISIKSIVDNNYINITVEDNGTGIDSNTLKDIYKPFFTTKQDGTGLGVCFSKEVIDALDGKINYYTEYGKWTKVLVSFPIQNSDD